MGDPKSQTFCVFCPATDRALVANLNEVKDLGGESPRHLESTEKGSPNIAQLGSLRAKTQTQKGNRCMVRMNKLFQAQDTQICSVFTPIHPTLVSNHHYCKRAIKSEGSPGLYIVLSYSAHGFGESSGIRKSEAQLWCECGHDKPWRVGDENRMTAHGYCSFLQAICPSDPSAQSHQRPHDNMIRCCSAKHAAG